MKVAKFQFAFFGVNTYVVYDPDTLECAIIDPGMTSEEEVKAMDDFIKDKKLKVTHLINTHMHIDHIIANKYVTEKYGVDTEAHPADEMFGERVENQAQMFGVGRQVEGVKIDKYLSDGDVVKIGNGELEVIHVPGHSPGSVVLYSRKDNFMISGDVLFAGSIGRTDLPGGSMTQLLTGIRSKLLVLPNDTLVLPGHGEATSIGEEKGRNLYLK